MKRNYINILVLFTLSLFINACAPTRTVSGIAYDNVTEPLENSVSTQFKFSKKDFDILGSATAKASSTNVMHLVSWGDNGYEQLKVEAKKMYPDMDDIINIRIDSHNFSVLFFYNNVELKLTGTAIKYKK